MVSPIDVATHGLLNSPLSVAAIRGRLTIDGVPPIPPVIPGGGGTRAVRGQWKHPYVLQERLRSQLEREDEEILAIIMAFMEINE